jgi:hypothetical protein
MLKRSIAVLSVIILALASALAENKDRVLVVMTRNMDAGSDFGFVTSATTPLGLIIGVTETYQEVVQSNIPERAQGIAAEIQARQPDLVACKRSPNCALARLVARLPLWLPTNSNHSQRRLQRAD